MKALAFFAVFFVTVGACASDFNVFFGQKAERHRIFDDFSELKNKTSIERKPTKDDRMVLEKIQLSFEEAMESCLKSKECVSARVILQTPWPVLPLRVHEDRPRDVTGTWNKHMNDVLIARQRTLIECSQIRDVKILLSYKNNGHRAINYENYLKIISKPSGFSDCKNCYNFFDQIQGNGAWYEIKMRSGKVVNFSVKNAYPSEDLSIDTLAKVSYSVA